LTFIALYFIVTYTTGMPKLNITVHMNQPSWKMLQIISATFRRQFHDQEFSWPLKEISVHIGYFR